MPKTNEFQITVHYADQCGNAKNSRYPYTEVASDIETFKRLVGFDHTFIRFRDGRRSKNNFENTSVVVCDCDNDHSDTPSEWIQPKDIGTAFPGVGHLIYTSQHHGKPKGGSSARPRFHVVFLAEPFNTPESYTEFLKKVHLAFPYFDENATDGGRFFFGNQDAEVWFQPGERTINDHMAEWDDNQALLALGEEIHEGSRNSDLFRYAVCIMKRLGDTEDAHTRFLDKADHCTPPLEDTELRQIWNSAHGYYEKIRKQDGYVEPEVYNCPQEPLWDTPLPFDEFTLPAFPVDALPRAIGQYVTALAESTQTPVDMAASAALPILSVCLQGKYTVRAKADWFEPLNLYSLIVMEPSERKSAVENAMVRPINRYEAEVNTANATAIEGSKMRKRVLERRQRAVEEQVAKGKAELADLDKIAAEIAAFREVRPLRLYVDDVTTEKLTSVLADNDGRAAILSTEGGIFDTLAGIYTKNVNIDVMLKGYSGDSIRVDRIGRNSESILNPTLTILLMVQPNVLSGLMQNGTFRGRGLTARFLYCMPPSAIGKRRYRSSPVPEMVYLEYERLLRNLLEDNYGQTPEVIRLSQGADAQIEAFAEELEPKLRQEYTDISDWAGKLVGNTLRIAGLLTRAAVLRGHDDFLKGPEPEPPLVVDGATMHDAIRISRYYIEHARAAFSLMGADSINKQSKYVLNAICSGGLTECTRRDIMRLCRSFKRADEVQPILDHLTDLGYLALKDNTGYSGKGRPPAQTYLVNPCLYEEQQAS